MKLTQEEQEISLLPCPFCGSTDVDPEGWMSGSAESGYTKGPACDNCQGSTGTVERWNTRIKAVAPTDTREALAKVIFETAFNTKYSLPQGTALLITDALISSGLVVGGNRE